MTTMSCRLAHLSSSSRDRLCVWKPLGSYGPSSGTTLWELTEEGSQGNDKMGFLLKGLLYWAVLPLCLLFLRFMSLSVCGVCEQTCARKRQWVPLGWSYRCLWDAWFVMWVLGSKNSVLINV